MENMHSGHSRGLSARVRPFHARTAAIAAAAVLSLSGIAAEPSTGRGLSTLDPTGLALPYGSEIIALGQGGPRRIAAWPGNARPRDAAAFRGGFVAWERKSKILYRASQSGLVALGRLDAARVYLSSACAISSDGIFQAGKGFGFTVWSWPGGQAGSLRRVAGFNLDCFVADCLFVGNRAFIAGADAADAANSLYELNLDSGAMRRIAMVPKRRDFGRLASDGKRLLFYTSVAEPGPGAPGGAGDKQTAATATLFELGSGGSAIAPTPMALSPGIEGASPYGSAFASGGRFYVPFAAGKGEGTRVWLCAFELTGADGRKGSAAGASASPIVKAISARALPTGLYASIGEADGACWAIGFLYVKDPDAFSVLRIDSSTVSATALPLPSGAP